MQSIPVFLDMEAKFVDLIWNNTDVSRTKVVCQMIHIIFGFSLGKENFITVGYVQQMLGRAVFLAFPSMSSPGKDHPKQG